MISFISMKQQASKSKFFVFKEQETKRVLESKELSAMLDEALSFSDTVICTGDLNSDILHPLADKKEGRCLLDVCHHHHHLYFI